MLVNVMKLTPDAIMPSKGTPGSACYDIAVNRRYLFAPGEAHKMTTGLVFEIPKNFEMEIRPRSGWASKQLILMNSPGTLDSDYRGELFALMINLSNKNIEVRKGDRVVQVKINVVEKIFFEEVEDISSTERGSNGFGSTGQ